MRGRQESVKFKGQPYRDLEHGLCIKLIFSGSPGIQLQRAREGTFLAGFGGCTGFSYYLSPKRTRGGTKYIHTYKCKCFNFTFYCPVERRAFAIN